MKLHTITGNNGYCGPAAIAALTGVTTDEAAAIIRKRTGRRSVKGTRTSEVTSALATLGYRTRVIPAPRTATGRRPTLAAFIRTRPDRSLAMIIEVTGHWMVLLGNMITDNGMKVPTRIGAARGRRRLVHRYIVVEKGDAAPALRERAEQARALAKRPRDLERKPRQQAKQLAARWGIEIESDHNRDVGSAWWVYPPEGLYADEGADPHDGEHHCISWFTVLDIVKTYAAELERKGVDTAA